MGSYPKYSEYKDSGVEWLGEIPKHWNSKRLKFLVTKIGSGKTPKGGSEVYLNSGFMLLRSQNIYDEGFKLDDVVYIDAKTESLQSGSRVFSGDVLLNITGASLGRSSLVPKPFEPANVNQHVCIFRPNTHKVISKYLHLLFCSSLGKHQIFSFENGTSREGLNFQQAGDLIFAIPPLEEQRSIAQFLDYKTAQIDALIAKKEELLERLAEKRTALISEAVTKGIDRTVPMKDSGIDWLGEIPKHWVAKRFKFMLSEPFKYGANEPAELNDPELPRYIRITDVNEDGTLRDETFRSLPEDVAKDFLLKNGDILLARSGATVGKSFIYNSSWGKAAYAGYLIRARTSDSIDSKFIYDFLQSSVYWQWVNSIFIQATIQNISAEKYANLWISIPPLEEQRSIAQFLDYKTAQIDALITKIQKAIETLKEYRTALITNAVTGKIDVRQVEIPDSYTQG